MRKLYDVHCHLIPGVDDGSRDLEESIRAIEEEYRQGVRTIICTSHISGKDTGEQGENIWLQFQNLKEALKERAFGREMKLYLGNEVFYSDTALELLKEGIANTMAGSQYVLVEFSPSVEYRVMYRGMRNLLTSGYLPILAHMERYECLAKEEHVRELEETGIYFQVNASTIKAGMFDAAANRVRKLVKQGRIHFLGTDSHGMSYRPPKIADAVKWIENHCGEEIARRILYEYPQAVIEDLEI